MGSVMGANQNVFKAKHPCRRPPATLQWVVFDILVWARAVPASRLVGPAGLEPAILAFGSVGRGI
jgi:hypothetical protein